ncbi:MAG: HAD family hydrolase [Myxococcota bacterium]
MDAPSRPDSSVPSSACERSVRVVAFDVDGTLVEHDSGLVVWQVLNRLFIGNAELNAERFRSFRDGELTYEQWVRLDIEGWRDGGATRAAMQEAIRAELRLVPGAQQVTSALRARGYRVVVVSGTLDIVLDTLFPEHPFDRIYSNQIRFDERGGIQDWTATPFDMAGKAEALRLLSSESGVPTDAFAFVGDHINDLHALRLVGCPIAYDPKDESVRKSAKHVLSPGELHRLLDLLPGPPPEPVPQP